MGTIAPVLTDDPDPELAPDAEVGEYRIVRKLGAGGFGTVYEGVQPLIGKPVAIKVLARRCSVDPEYVNRFVAEARAVNQIRHRNIIDIFGFGKLPDGRHYYVMELLEGETLADRLDRDGKVPVDVALPILAGVARALDAAHGKGIAHRDLKPGNVFLTRDGDVKLLDFGIAKLLHVDEASGPASKTRTGTVLGTPYYMSPEQCRGKADVDHRTDVYALGVVAFQTLAGAFPIDGDEPMVVMFNQIYNEPEAASRKNPALPRTLDVPLAAMMRKEPGERPATAGEAIRALELARHARPPRRWPFAVAGLLAIAAGIATFVLVRDPDDDPPPPPLRLPSPPPESISVLPAPAPPKVEPPPPAKPEPPAPTLHAAPKVADPPKPTAPAKPHNRDSYEDPFKK